MSYQLGPAMSSAKEVPGARRCTVLCLWGGIFGVQALDKFREAGDKTGEAGVGGLEDFPKQDRLQYDKLQ